jgi:hypothetical protein
LNFYCGKPPTVLADVDRTRLVKLLGLLGSAHDGERAAAARKAHEHIKALGLQWGDVIIEAVEALPDLKKKDGEPRARVGQGERVGNRLLRKPSSGLARSGSYPEATRGARSHFQKMRGLARLHQLTGLGDAKLLKSLECSIKGRHYRA